MTPEQHEASERQSVSTPTKAKPVYTAIEASRKLGCTPRSVYRLYESRRLQGYRIQGSQDIRITHESLEAFLASGGMDSLSEDQAPKNVTQQLVNLNEEITRLRAEVERLEAEQELSHHLTQMQAAILSRAAIAFRGPEPELTKWSHHDVGELAEQVVAERDRLREEVKLLTEVNHQQWHEINSLNELQDCKGALQRLGRICGCDHVESADERAVQVDHIEEAFDELRDENERLHARASTFERRALTRQSALHHLESLAKRHRKAMRAALTAETLEVAKAAVRPLIEEHCDAG